jgi:hypothetical protein
MKIKTTLFSVAALCLCAIAGWLQAAPTVDDVGDVGSFGHPANYMGAASGFVTVTDICPSPTPTPSPAFDAQDICRIKLPKKATKTIIYPVLNFFYDYTMDNTTVSDGQARFQFFCFLTIESDALLDPSIIDPSTGLPANGKLVMQFGPNRVFDDRHLDPGEHCRNRLTFARAGNAGINKAQLVASGLSATVVDNLFASSMTIRMNITGTAKLVSFASITGNMRLFGD